MVDDDLPALVGLFEDEAEEAVGWAAIFLAAFEVVFADADGESLVEGVDFELGEGERAHGGLAGIVVLVLFEQAGEAAVDAAADEERIGRILVDLGEGLDVAAVPGRLLLEEDLDDVELLPAGGVELLFLLRCGSCAENGGRKEDQAESGSGETGSKLHRRPRREDFSPYERRHSNRFDGRFRAG